MCTVLYSVWIRITCQMWTYTWTLVTCARQKIGLRPLVSKKQILFIMFGWAKNKRVRLRMQKIIYKLSQNHMVHEISIPFHFFLLRFQGLCRLRDFFHKVCACRNSELALIFTILLAIKNIQRDYMNVNTNPHPTNFSSKHTPSISFDLTLSVYFSSLLSRSSLICAISLDQIQKFSVQSEGKSRHT